MIRKPTTLLIGLLALLAIAAKPAAAQDADAGEKIAEQNCARCHAIGRTGDSALKEAPPFRDVIKRYPVSDLAEALAEGIVVGHEAMPEFAFTPEKIEDLLAYLDSLDDAPAE